MGLRWQAGETEIHQYWYAEEGQDYLYVFRHKAGANGFWHAIINNCPLYDKTRNNKQRKIENKSSNCDVLQLHSIYMLASTDPEYIKAKAEAAWREGVIEVSSRANKTEEDRIDFVGLP